MKSTTILRATHTARTERERIHIVIAARQTSKVAIWKEDVMEEGSCEHMRDRFHCLVS